MVLALLRVAIVLVSQLTHKPKRWSPKDPKSNPPTSNSAAAITNATWELYRWWYYFRPCCCWGEEVVSVSSSSEWWSPVHLPCSTAPSNSVEWWRPVSKILLMLRRPQCNWDHLRPCQPIIDLPDRCGRSSAQRLDNTRNNCHWLGWSSWSVFGEGRRRAVFRTWILDTPPIVILKVVVVILFDSMQLEESFRTVVIMSYYGYYLIWNSGCQAGLRFEIWPAGGRK